MDKTAVRIVTLLAIGATFLSTAACSGSGSDSRTSDTIFREEFVNAYFELRKTGLRSGGMDITLDARDSVLAQLGLTEDELLACVDVWGSDGEIMLSIWEEVDSLMRAARDPRREEAEKRLGEPGEKGTDGEEVGGDGRDMREAGGR